MRGEKENFFEEAKLLQWRMEFFHTLGSLYFLTSFFTFFSRGIGWTEKMFPLLRGKPLLGYKCSVLCRRMNVKQCGFR